MSRKRLLLAMGILLLLVAGTGLTLLVLVKHEPAFYQRAEIPGGEPRRLWSREFTGEFASQLMNGIINGRNWDPKFTESQINSYFAEEFLSTGASQSIPDSFSAPRVSLDNDRLRIGFRYGKGTWSTVVSVDLRIWLAADVPNAVVLEVQGLSAGALPISAHSVLERLAESARRQDIEVSWYRHEGKRVALLRFQPGRRDPTVQLKRVKLLPGALYVSGGPPPRNASTAPAHSGAESAVAIP